MIKAIVFDFDGTIFDTEGPEFKSYQEIFAEHGHELDLNIWSQGVGTVDGFHPFDHLEACTGQAVNRDALRVLQKEKYGRFIAEETILPGVEEYLKAAKELGLHVGLASSSSRAWVTKHLDQLNVAHYFDVVRVRDDVRKAKPDPELYRQVIDHFGISPQEAIAFEDSPNGALAAKAAGLYCVTVPNGVTRGLPFCDIDIRLQTMSDMKLDALIQQLLERSSQ
ncbi:HAD family phosphatase [Paenibacillus sp. R14(2021)]|uniref:HAD family hydrolase n=1 Tax=Paenibacillus sp. R14(2021) TaxID=2859228 RepID=UPI001C616540|nr:HAD-IA family hydrolase [Paenibacillus sp. R14(2021)]